MYIQQRFEVLHGTAKNYQGPIRPIRDPSETHDLCSVFSRCMRHGFAFTNYAQCWRVGNFGRGSLVSIELSRPSSKTKFGSDSGLDSVRLDFCPSFGFSWELAIFVQQKVRAWAIYFVWFICFWLFLALHTRPSRQNRNAGGMSPLSMESN